MTITRAAAAAALLIAASCDASPPSDVCARTAAIVNGSRDLPAALGAAAESVVAVRVESRVGDEAFEEWCTGTRVDGGHIVTAAHCFGGGDSFELAISAGAVAPVSDDCAAGAALTRLPSQVVRLHAQWDVAVIEAAQPAGPVTAPCAALPEVGAAGFVAGFGLSEQGTLGVRRYLATTVTSVSDDAIDVRAPTEAGACVGDSGGPLFVQQNGEWCVAGALSAGTATCRGLDRYVPLSALREWLRAPG